MTPVPHACNQFVLSISIRFRQLDLLFYEDKDEIDVKDYTSSNEWVLVGHPAIKHEIYYPCCPEPFPDLTFTIKIKRLAVFYNFTLILPCVLLSILTLVIFWLPPENPAKMILGKETKRGWLGHVILTSANFLPSHLVFPPFVLPLLRSPGKGSNGLHKEDSKDKQHLHNKQYMNEKRRKAKRKRIKKQSTHTIGIQKESVGRNINHGHQVNVSYCLRISYGASFQKQNLNSNTWS